MIPGAAQVDDELRVSGRGLSRAAYLGKRSPARNELLQKGQEECLAEATEWRFGLQVERPSDDVAIELVKDDPDTQIDIEASAAFFDRWYFHREPVWLRLLRRDRKKEYEVPIRSRDPDADCHRPVLASLRFSLARLAAPQVRIPDDGSRLDLVISTHRLVSSLSA
ncbi:MAG: hypothetical protein KKH33_22705 [Alphaproteobacteria bacterium]|nr:hypothetical protein [Alphaproteobacteria bacterium]